MPPQAKPGRLKYQPSPPKRNCRHLAEMDSSAGNLPQSARHPRGLLARHARVPQVHGKGGPATGFGVGGDDGAVQKRRQGAPRLGAAQQDATAVGLGFQTGPRTFGGEHSPHARRAPVRG